ncbi:MAG: crossover junction endodeoxyribonuclease RuvC [Gammaproteobacteria bacterium]|nr:MAG: crossover junction endodeoxyribonuclease RuvC [Gammaproteobacteria bacterium]
MRILGIDPGSRATGYGIIEIQGSRHWHVTSGVLQVSGADITARLGGVFAGIRALAREYQPAEAAIERVFMARNADAALKLGQARGAALCGLAEAGCPVAEYAPREIKLAVVGTGAADKRQVQHMVRRLLGLPEAPPADAADALAVALCHAHVRQTRQRLARAGRRT